MEWMPLELWRAASLAQETKTVEAMFERFGRAGDESAVDALRRSIEARIDALETFYIDHDDDERAVLFEKQQLKLRKLLHDYDNSVMQQRPPAAASPGSAQPSRSRSQPEAGRAEGRLTYSEMLAWFRASGKGVLSLVDEKDLKEIFSGLAAKTDDGLVSTDEIKHWYAAFGQKHLAARQRKSRQSGAMSRQTPRSKAKGKKPAPLYAWETQGSRSQRRNQESADSPKRSGRGLRDQLIEFQIRMSDESYQKYVCKLRNLSAEQKHHQRMRTAEKKSTMRRGKSDPSAAHSLIVSGPYVEPTASRSNVFRAEQPRKWLTSNGFDV